MLKVIVATLFLSSLFLFSVSDKIENISQTFSTPSPTKTPFNEKENGVEDLILDSESVSTWCPFQKFEGEECSKHQLEVKVITSLEDGEKNNLKYYYEASDGQIIGQGASVIWDFSKVMPGTYTITARIEKDNKTYGRTITKTVEVRECSCCLMPCECPTIEVISPKENVHKGELVEFKANVSGGSQDSVEYHWTAQNGIIFEGQGTSVIKVQVLSGENVTAIVEIGGLCETCPTTDSESIKIVD